MRTKQTRRDLVWGLLVAALIMLSLAIAQVSRETMPGANWGCTAAPLPFNLNNTIIGTYADEYCHA